MNQYIEQRVAVMVAVIDFLISAESLLENAESSLIIANHQEAINNLKKLENYTEISDYREVCQAGIQAYMHLHHHNDNLMRFDEQEIFTQFIQSPIRGINNLITLYDKGYVFG
jgi:hypothetical protein